MTVVIWRRVTDGFYKGRTRAELKPAVPKMEYSIVRRMHLGLPTFFLERLMPRGTDTDLKARTVYLCDAKQFAELHARQWGGGQRPIVTSADPRRV